MEYQLEETLLELPIPCLILQPIVENAIEHGLRSSRRQPRRLIIAPSEEKGICFIRVCDNGCGIPDKMQGLFACETTHIGIKSVNERLKLSYGDNLGLIMNSEADNGTEVIIRIPLQKNSPKPWKLSERKEWLPALYFAWQPLFYETIYHLHHTYSQHSGQTIKARRHHSAYHFRTNLYFHSPFLYSAVTS